MENKIELTGKYTNPKMFIESIDEATMGQVIKMSNEKAMEGSQIRIMPDAHWGKGSTVGTTIFFENGIKRVVPDVTGVDIGCSISATKINKNHLDESELKKLDAVINEYVPSGFNVNNRPTNRVSQKEVDNIINNLTVNKARKGKEKSRIKKAVGTLGGGNHYIALEKFEDDIYLMIHTGSRRLGYLVANHHQGIADSLHEELDFSDVIRELKENGREREIEATLKRMHKEHVVPNLKYLEGDKLVDDYLNDMYYAQAYARLNHQAIANEILSRMGWEVDDKIHSMHNYIDLERNIIRKGATDASKGNRLIVPLNMRDGSLIAVGKGNEDWNHSAPHGAGRVLSRSKAKELLSLDEYMESMNGVYSSSIMQSTLDEAPKAYKPKKEIIDNTKDTMDIIAEVKPIYNFKAH